MTLLTVYTRSLVLMFCLPSSTAVTSPYRHRDPFCRGVTQGAQIGLDQEVAAGIFSNGMRVSCASLLPFLGIL